jgi:hypothetical protein
MEHPRTQLETKLQTVDDGRIPGASIVRIYLHR